MSGHLRLEDVNVVLGGQTIVRHINFSLDHGQIACLLGPSGCGKTTILRTVAGFEVPESGSVFLRGQRISRAGFRVAPERRNIGMVFQDLALFPHLTISGNVEFGIRHLDSRSRKQRVGELLELAGLAAQAERYPHELSGGQQQRVALVRAMAPRPEILLLDEPFSGQDLELREKLAHEVRAILKHEKITAMLVTHDQHEAFAFADLVGVVQDGEIHQWDDAYNLYHRPATRFVADFIGQGVFISGTVREGNSIDSPLGTLSGDMDNPLQAGTEVDLLIRPDDVIHDDHSPYTGIVVAKSFRGANFMYTLELDKGIQVFGLAPSHHDHDLGERMGVHLELDHLVAFARG